MPVIIRKKEYRFWFYHADLAEPAHVHVGQRSPSKWIISLLIKAYMF